ncbi:hypothetical protein AB205_0002940, partial [Aquarana catesbeiana]
MPSRSPPRRSLAVLSVRCPPSSTSAPACRRSSP